MANKGKDTNTSQFFLTMCASPNLDFKHTVFGEIIKSSASKCPIEIDRDQFIHRLTPYNDVLSFMEK